jgi:hypothetical protein
MIANGESFALGAILATFENSDIVAADRKLTIWGCS